MAVNLGFTPKEFWDMTFYELWAAFDAKHPKYIEPMTKDDLDEMLERNPD